MDLSQTGKGRSKRMRKLKVEIKVIPELQKSDDYMISISENREQLHWEEQFSLKDALAVLAELLEPGGVKTTSYGDFVEVTLKIKYSE